MPAGLIRLFCDLATGVVPSAFWSGEGSLVTRLEFVRIGSYHRWGCAVDATRTCATDVPQALAPKGPGRAPKRLTCADVSGAGPARTTTGGFKFLMCHKCATSDCQGMISSGVRRIAGL